MRKKNKLGQFVSLPPSKRRKGVLILFNPQEKKRVERNAKRAGKKFAVYVREKALET